MKPLLYVLLGLGSALASEAGSFDRTLQVSSLADLDIVSNIGGIIVTVGDPGTIRIRAVLKSKYGPVDLGLAASNIRALEQNPPIAQDGNRIRIGYTQNPQAMDGVSMRLEIEAPLGSRIHAATTSGGIRIDGVKGQVTSRTHSGGIQIRDAKGEVRAQTQSGRLEAEQIHGNISASTRSGAIHLSQTAAAAIQARTETGAVRVSLAPGAGYQILAQSSSGRIDAPDFGIAKGSATHNMRRTVGTGGPLVDIRTNSSSIAIQQP